MAGTLVETERGFIAIENVQVGDIVRSVDPYSEEKTLNDVTRKYEDESDELISLVFDGQEIRCTPSHRFSTPAAWTPARELKPGDYVRTSSGGSVRLIGSEVDRVRQRVFNLEVAQNPSYLVGKRALLVHNLKDQKLPPDPPVRDE